MKSLIKPVPNGLSINLNIKDGDGKEILTTSDTINILKRNQGYIDGDRRQLIIFPKKVR